MTWVEQVVICTLLECQQMAMKQRFVQILLVTNNQFCVRASSWKYKITRFIYIKKTCILAVFYYETCVPSCKTDPTSTRTMSTSRLWYTFLVSEPLRNDGTVHFHIL